MAIKDPLTQIYNRRYYFSTLGKIIDENSKKMFV